MGLSRMQLVCVKYAANNEMWAQSGIYRNKRRAKKEVTHYLEKGMNCGPWYGNHAEYKRGGLL